MEPGPDIASRFRCTGVSVLLLRLACTPETLSAGEAGTPNRLPCNRHGRPLRSLSRAGGVPWPPKGPAPALAPRPGHSGSSRV